MFRPYDGFTIFLGLFDKAGFDARDIEKVGFRLAETGLVDGLSVATHQICAEAVAKRFPKIVVDTNQRIIDQGGIITAGGFLSWVDLGLFLVTGFSARP
jgi:transcriptional regulator GlxA family with amidase domain